MKTTLHPKSRRLLGFTLVETIVVISVIGILSAMIIPRVANIAEVAREQDAVARAHVLNQAMFTYMQRVPGANGAWTSAGDDAARFSLLHNAGFLPGTSSSLTAFTPDNFTFSFPSTLNFNSMRVTVSKTGNRTISY